MFLTDQFSSLIFLMVSLVHKIINKRDFNDVFAISISKETTLTTPHNFKDMPI